MFVCRDEDRHGQDAATVSMAGERVLLLAPSRGLGGGIERVAHAVEEAYGDRALRCDLYGAGAHGTRGGSRAKADFTRRATAVALRGRPRLVLALHVGLLPVAFATARLTGARVALLGHGTEVWAPMPKWRRELVRRCWRLLAVSTFTATWLARRAALDPGRIRVVPLPVGEQFARAARAGRVRAERAGDRPPTLLTVSRIVAEHRYKGHMLVAAAVPSLLEQCPGARWRVIGAGDDVPRLREYCRTLGIVDTVEFAGATDEASLLRSYAEADALVLPSSADPEASPPEGEGFGLVYAEAGALAVPAVASRRGGGALDFVEDSVTGLTVEPHPAAIAHAAALLLAQRELRCRLGEAARRRVLARHLPEHFAVTLRDALAPHG